MSELVDKGVKIAIGTGGASSNNALDMFREMYLISVLQKVVTKNPQAISAYEALEMATINGAMAMGLNKCTTLSAGNKADLIMIDLNMANMQPENDLINNLVYSGGKQNVVMTMINGQIVYKRGEFLTIDSEKVYYETNRMMEKLRK